MLNITNKIKIIASGCSKIAYQIDDENIILCCKRIHDNKDNFLQTELKMIQYLESFGLPMIENVQIIDICNYQIGSSLGLLQKYIKNSEILKPNSSPPVKLPEKLVPILKDIFLKLQTHKILIEDLHFIYNDNELYIIDPFNVFNLSDLTHIGHYRDRNFYHQTNIKYINQIKKLKKLLDFNTSPS